MLCKIADLIVEVPEMGGMTSRCQKYLYQGTENSNIIIKSELYSTYYYPDTIEDSSLAYMESGRQFYVQLLYHDGFYLHSSAVSMDGRAYLFSADSGVGKSTHAQLWKNLFGEAVQVINDDKPALRCIEGGWYVYGTPWCGKDGINQNVKVPLAGICFLKQSTENRIRLLTQMEALTRILPQTIYRLRNTERLDLLLNHIESMMKVIPMYELECRPDTDAAQLSYEIMSCKAKEMGL